MWIEPAAVASVPIDRAGETAATLALKPAVSLAA